MSSTAFLVSRSYRACLRGRRRLKPSSPPSSVRVLLPMLSLISVHSSARGVRPLPEVLRTKKPCSSLVAVLIHGAFVARHAICYHAMVPYASNNIASFHCHLAFGKAYILTD